MIEALFVDQSYRTEAHKQERNERQHQLAYVSPV